MPDNRTAVISPEGEQGYIPQEKLQEAVSRGFKPAVMVTSPEGESGFMPKENVGRAIKERGFTVGQSTAPPPADAPTTTWDAAKGVAKDTWGAVKGAAEVFDPRIKKGETALTANPAARIAKGVVETGKQALQVPAAIHDINQSPDPTGTYLDVAQKTASQGAGQAILAAATEGATKIPASAAETAVRTTGKLVKGIAEDVPIVRKVIKVGKYAKEAAGETAARRGSQPPAFPQYETPAPKATEAAAPEANVHPDAAQFEQIYKVPLDNYIDESGKFNTKDFLSEVVKPKTEPPNAVITRTFGSDGVDLVNKLNGKPLEKWESSAPESEPKGGSARLRAKEILKGDRGEAGAPGTISEYHGRVATAEKTGEVSARGFLKKVGADEGSVLNGAGRTPMEHADSVIYHREQIRAGKSTPVELHVDESGNVIGADGRHRAIAAIQEHGPTAKIKVKIMKHSFQGVD